MIKNEYISEFIEPNSDSFLGSIVKMAAYFLLLICNILFYYHFSVFWFGELAADIIFWLFLIVLVLTFTVDHQWSYDFCDRTLLIKLKSNLIGFNCVVVNSDGEVLKREMQFGAKRLELNINDFQGISKIALKKSDDSKILCRLEK
jgi:hypothetical protein